MSHFNIFNSQSLQTNYQSGLLPQRNSKNNFYQETSCRANLKDFKLSSENRRILKKTDYFNYELTTIKFDIAIQKQIYQWLKKLEWDFPISSVKTIFSDHIFNYLYTWKHHQQTVAYSVCLFDQSISHIAYVFYDPAYSNNDLPIRLVLQCVIDSQQMGLDYSYLGRFDPETKIGFYKRTLPGFEYYKDGQWIKYQH